MGLHESSAIRAPTFHVPRAPSVDRRRLLRTFSSEMPRGSKRCTDETDRTWGGNSAEERGFIAGSGAERLHSAAAIVRPDRHSCRDPCSRPQSCLFLPRWWKNSGPMGTTPADAIRTLMSSSRQYQTLLSPAESIPGHLFEETLQNRASGSGAPFAGLLHPRQTDDSN
jgi:hypothetical protein